MLHRGFKCSMAFDAMPKEPGSASGGLASTASCQHQHTQLVERVCGGSRIARFRMLQKL